MSTDWNVKCLDCDDVCTFDDANHQDVLMSMLCKHAEAIAALAPLLASACIELRTDYGPIDATWFARHVGHRLRPISEYGDLLGQCAEHLPCQCGVLQRCILDAEHGGDHTLVKP